MKRIRTGNVAKRIAAFALTGILVVSSSVLVAPAAADTDSAELQAAIAKLNDLGDALAQSEAELGRTNYLLEGTKSRIAEVEEQIAKNEKDLDKAKEHLATVIEESYKQGGEAGLLDIVLSSDSFDTLLSRVYYANKVAQKKHAAINGINDVINELNTNKSRLQEQQQMQEALLATQKEQHAAMEEAALRQANYVNNLSDAVVAGMAEQRARNAEQSTQTAQSILGDAYVATPAVTQTNQTTGDTGNTNQEDPSSNPSDNGSSDSGSTDSGYTDNGSSDNGSSENGSSENGSSENGYTEGGSTDNGQGTGGVVASSDDYTSDSGSSSSDVYDTPSEPSEPSDPSGNTSGSEQPTDDAYSSDSTSSGSSSAGGYSSDAAMIAVNAALAQVGKGYSHNNDGNTWDCNGLTNYAWGEAGLEIPYGSGTYANGQFQYMQSSSNYTNSADDLNAGDLVFYSKDGGETCFHVAMYIGDGQIVHAVGEADGVQVTSLDYVSGFCGGGSPY